MSIAVPVQDETAEEWDAQHVLESLSDQVRNAAPDGCCVHGETFCLSCGLAWVVEQNVPIRLDSNE